MLLIELAVEAGQLGVRLRYQRSRLVEFFLCCFKLLGLCLELLEVLFGEVPSLLVFVVDLQRAEVQLVRRKQWQFDVLQLGFLHQLSSFAGKTKALELS